MQGGKTSREQADSEEKHTSLFRIIHNWCKVQLAYTPQVASFVLSTLGINMDSTELEVEKILLYLHCHHISGTKLSYVTSAGRSSAYKKDSLMIH